MVAAFERTAVREHMSLGDAIAYQFGLVDAIQRVMGSDEVFVEDYGQVRSLATVGFGGGGRPRATARAEEVLARFFEAEDAVFVHGAGTGAIRAMLNAALKPGARVLLHKANPYKTTLSTMEHMGLDLRSVDFNSPESLREGLKTEKPEAVYVQRVPQGLGDVQDLRTIISVTREEFGEHVPVLVDDNYAAMRCPQLGVQMGADASALSLFKLLAAINIGCVLGPGEIVSRIRRDLSSAGCQVEGRDAMDALRSLVYAPVALAIQNQVVEEAAARINELIAGGELPYLHRAIPTQPGNRSIVLIFDRPIAEDFLKSAWSNGSPSQSVGEEARYEVLPLFTYLASTFLKATPELRQYAIRINPLRGGSDTILRVLSAALKDLAAHPTAAAGGVAG